MDRETRTSSEHSIFQGNRCLIPLAHSPTGYRYNFRSFTTLSFQCIHSYTPNTCSSSAQPASRTAAKIPVFPLSSRGQENCCHSERVRNYPRKEQSSLVSEIINILVHINQMGPLLGCRLKGDSTKALTLTPITRSSNARQPLSHQESNTLCVLYDWDLT